MSFFSRKMIALAVLGAASGSSMAIDFQVNTRDDAPDISLGNGSCLTASNACSLRAAIQEANAQPGGPHTIRLQPETYKLTLSGFEENTAATGDLDINSNVSIEGLGASADSTIIQLQAGSSGGNDYRIFHIGANGGQNSVTIKNLSIKGGMSSLGAGIYLQTGTLDLIDSQIDGNSANVGTIAMGGGIYSQGTLRIRNSTIANNSVQNNTTSGTGGGIYIANNAISTQITNSTIANNTVSGTQGAGIYNASSSVIIASSTITNNTASGANANGLGIANIGNSLQIKNTILAQHRNSSGQTVSDCVGSIVSGGNNFVGMATSNICALTQGASDQVGTFATLNLGTLTNNGGPTQTMLPLAGSPVIDKGASSGCIAADGITLLTTDQRGQARSVAGAVGQQLVCDIGATEYNPSSTGGTGASSGPAGMGSSFTAYANTPMGGSLAGFNPDLIKTDTTTSASGLIFTQVTANSRVIINSTTGFFYYTPGGFTGLDSFIYSVKNASSQTATNEVKINVQAGYSPGNSLPVVPTNINVSVKPTNKLRMSLPYADADQQNTHFTLYLGTVPNLQTQIQTQKGAVSAVSNHQNSTYLEYTPFDNASGTDTFQITVFDGGSYSASVPVTVNIGGTTGGTPALTAVSSTPGANRALTGQVVVSGSLAANVANPPAQPVYEVSTTGLAGTWSTTSANATYGRVDLPATNPGNYTYTVTYTGGVPTNINTDVLYFRVRDINSTIVSNPSTITINFGSTSVTNPTTSAAALNNVGRTASATSTGTLTQNVSSPPAQPVYEVSTTGVAGTWSTTSVNTTYGRVDLSNTIPGNYTYTVTYSGGVPATVNTDVLYFRVRDINSTVFSSSSTLTINFGAGTGTPFAGAHIANSVPRTGMYSSASPLSLSVTSPPANAVYEVALNGTTNFQTSAVGSYGTLQIGFNGTYTYTVNSFYSSTGVPVGVTQESFQYRVRDTNSTVFSTPTSLTINFAAGTGGSLPEALPQSAIRATPGQPTTISLTYMTSAKSHTAVFGTKYVITSLPGQGKVYDASTGVEITSTILELTSNQIRYLPNTGTTGTDMFSFKVREPVSAGSLSYLDSQTATVNIDLSGTATGTSLDEGGGGSMGPLALLALIGLYARRRIK